MDNKQNINSDIDTLVVSFMDGTISHDDFALLKAWTFANTQNREYVRRRIDVLVTSDVLFNNTEFNEAQAFDRFLQHIKPTEKTAQLKPLHLNIWRVAAGIAVAILLILLPWAGYKAGTIAVKDNLAQIETVTPQGSQATITLPDGTVVRLKQGSRLLYSQNFGIESRDVTIEGEAHFNVKHMSDHDFRVKTGALTIVDKGTEFSVRNYETESFVSVELEKGKVMVENSILKETCKTMLPGDRIVVNKKTGHMEKLQIAKDTIYKKLVFEDAKLEKVASILSNAYGVKIHLSNKIKDKLFNGRFNIGQTTLDNILDNMSATRQIQYRKEGKTYYIY